MPASKTIPVKAPKQPSSRRPLLPVIVGIQDIAGIGEALADRILKEFGSEDAFFTAAKGAEIDRLSAVEGISTKKAVEIVLTVQGRAPTDFLRTPRAEQLYEDILEHIAFYANTDYARNRIQLLVPLPDRKAREQQCEFVLQARDRLAERDRDKLAGLLKRLHRPRTPRPRYDSTFAILVDTDQDYEALVKGGVDKHCRILTPDDSGFNDGYEVILYAYSTGALDLTGAENVISVPFSRHVRDLVPEAALHYFRENRALWETARALAQELDRPTVLDDVLAVLDGLDAQEVDFDAVETIIRDVTERMNAELAQKAQALSLTGAETLEMMSGKLPRKVHDLQTEVLRAGRDAILKETGDDFPVFTDGFPVKVDEEALERHRHEFIGRRKRGMFREKVEAARRLAKLQEAVEAEVQAFLDFDYEFALASFALDYRLTRPKWGKAFELRGGLHLHLAAQLGSGKSGDPVDYALTQRENVALLTGANSGGKTTLLETIAHIALLAHMGLPVNAEEATVDEVDGLYFFTQKRSLDAGAFESFLRGFVPIVTTKAKKLVLADELEAMTELEAAAKIVGTFVDLLQSSKSYGVCVTHMAQEVSKHAHVRIDGIEARGLDENLNLIVDRTPRMNYRARSTPEFILQRLAHGASGEEKRVYEKILRTFTDAGKGGPP